MSLNKVFLQGNLGEDPVLRHTKDGTSVCNFSMATTESWINKEGEKDQSTVWHRIVVWGKQAEKCEEFLNKGSGVLVEGSITTKKYTGTDGIERTSFEIRASKVNFLDKRPDVA